MPLKPHGVSSQVQPCNLRQFISTPESYKSAFATLVFTLVNLFTVYINVRLSPDRHRLRRRPQIGRGRDRPGGGVVDHRLHLKAKNSNLALRWGTTVDSAYNDT